MNLDKFGNIYSELDDGKGVCRYFNKIARSCSIYDRRPLKCRIDEGYKYLKHIPYKEYIWMTYQACEYLQRITFGDEEKREGRTMDDKSPFTALKKILTETGEGDKKPGWLDSLAGMISNPASPENIIKMAKKGLEASIGCVRKNNQEVEEFEKEAERIRLQGDELQRKVRNTWHGLKKCASEDEYLQEEGRIAFQLEQEMMQKAQQKRIGE